MRTVSLRLADLERSTIPIGFQGENLHTQVRIDCKMIFKDYPAAVVSLAVTPPKGDPYPAMVIRDGDIVAWNVTASDTANHGDGRVQFTFVDGEEVIKTVRGKTNIAESDVPSGTAPPPIQNWITIANVVLDEAARVVEAASHAPIIDDNGYWAVWDADAEEYVATEYKAQGTDGHDGVGIVSIEKTGTSGLVDTYTITFTSGSPVTYTVTNGRDADPTALIDDTSTGTGRTWSAKKISDENLSLLTQINSRYTKPNTGIPATDMASAVQASLAKADTALQGESVVSAVDDWLDENITNPDSPPLDRSLSSSSAAAPADILGGLMAHESYGLTGSDAPTVEYDPVTADETVSSAYVNINGYGNAVYSSPSGTDVKIYAVTLGKTYKVKGKGSTTRPLCVVSDSKVTSGTIGTSGNFDCAYGSESSAAEEETEYTALRSGYLYITYSSANCGLWEKVVTPASERKYYMDDIRNVNLPLIASGLNKSVFREKTDSASALVKQVPRNAESIAKVTSVSDSVSLVRSIVSRNIVNKNNVGTVVIDAEGTEKTGIQTIHVPAGSYYVILGNVGTYTQVKKVENGIYTNLYKDQFPMKLGITDPSGGYFIVYAGSIEYLGDVSGIMIGLLKDDENTLSFEEYSEKTYTPEALEVNPYIEVTPRGFIEFVNSGNADVSSTVKYLVSGKDDDTTTSKDFMVSPDGTKYLPMVKNDGSVVCARVVPKKALFIGNSLTSGWQTFGETATDSDNDFVANFSSYISTLDNTYSFSRKWATGFEQQTSLANAQSWVTTNIDPLLSSDLDLIVVQLCENVVGNASLSATFPASSLWLMQHLRETCPKARVVWMGLWFERGWTKMLLDNTKKAGCEYIDIRKLYTPENIGYIGLVYKMDSDFTKEYTVDSFVVDDGEITLNFTVDGTEYTATIPSYTSYTSSGDTQISVTGVYHVADTYYAAIHPGNEGFRKIANKMLFDLGISDSEETIPAT